MQEIGTLQGRGRKRIIDITGNVYGRLTVLSFTGVKKSGKYQWLCKCTCGTVKLVNGRSLRRGESRSCGCLRDELTRQREITHGKKGTKIYEVWQNMKDRCTNPNAVGWHNYGGRGITVCEAWLHSFESFFSDMGDLPFPKAEIDRIDTNGNYEPSNCRWVTHKDNARNSRKALKLTARGETLNIYVWAERTGLMPGTIRNRIKYGWSVEQILDPELHKNKKTKNKN